MGSTWLGQLLALTSRNNYAGASTTVSVSGQQLWVYPVSSIQPSGFCAKVGAKPSGLGNGRVLWGFGSRSYGEKRGLTLVTVTS